MIELPRVWNAIFTPEAFWGKSSIYRAKTTIEIIQNKTMYVKTKGKHVVCGKFPILNTD